MDAGRGVAEGLRLSKIPVSQPGTVLLTNLMPTNTQGLDDLIFMLQNTGFKIINTVLQNENQHAWLLAEKPE